MTFFERVKQPYLTYRNKLPDRERTRAVILFWLQLSLILLLCTTIVLVSLVNTGNRLVLYLLLVIGLLVILASAFALNIAGKYRVSAWLTIAAMVIGPWGSILLDNSIVNGDYMPLVYIALSVQLCSIFLSTRATLLITAVQLAALLTIILLSPNIMVLNWPSLLAFILFMSTLGIVSTLVTRRQVEQIEKQKQQLLEMGARFQELSVRDSLTGLFNRRYMEETLEREINLALRKNRSLGIIMMDIDEFKQINDHFGHSAGDLILREVAKVLSSGVRQSDIVCRYGGDEILLILPECSLDEATRRAQALRSKIAEAQYQFQSMTLGKVSLSFGTAALPGNGVSSEDLLKAADDALYRQKRSALRYDATAEKYKQSDC
jgi:diguanylate cyclase (GGDEF)-like protein